MPELIVLTLAGYLLGSLSGGLLLGRLKNIDIRTIGSGNAGGTNALRAAGWPFALAVTVIDIAKGAIAAGALPLLAAWISATPVSAELLTAACGLAAVIGHIWPVYFRFHGGKGAGTALGVVAATAPWTLAPMLLVWVVAIIGTGFVGLATILAGLSLVPAMWLLGPEPLPPAYGALAIALAIVLIYTHRGNVARMRAGSESRFERARLLRRKRQ